MTKFNYDKEIPNSGKSLLWREKNLLMNASEFKNPRERNSVRASEQERVKLGLRGLRVLLSRRLKGESKSERKGISREGKTLSPSPSPRRGWQGLSAFTLAEVLITLTVLGVIAAITVPSIVRNFQDRAQITGVKKAYSMLDNALHQMYAIEGDPNTWDWPAKNANGNFKQDNTNDDFFSRKLYSYIAVERYCGTAYGCFTYGWKSDGSKYISGTDITFKTLTGVSNAHSAWNEQYTRGKAVLKNGMTMSIIPNEHIMKISGMGGIFTILRVDINGAKGPNRAGYDIFFFPVNKDGIMTHAVGNDYFNYIFNKNDCSLTSTSYLVYAGTSCAYWIMKHNNMDYKYKDVSSQW